MFLSTRFVVLASLQATSLLLSPSLVLPVTVTEVISSVREQALKVQSLEGWIEHEMEPKNEIEHLSGKFYYKAPHELKVHYVSPKEVYILLLGDSVLTYVPSTQEVTLISSSSTDLIIGEQRGYLNLILDPITPLQRDYNFSFLCKGPIEGYDEVWVIQGGPTSSESSVSKLLFWVDSKMGKVLRAEVYNAKGALVLIALLTEFGEAAPDLWLPGRYSVSLATSEGKVEMETRLSRLKVNKSVEERVFQLELPEGAKIVRSERR